MHEYLIPATLDVAPLLKSGRGMRNLVLILFLPLAIAACHGDGLGTPGSGHPDSDAPADVAPPPCTQLTTTAACGARSDCEVASCPDCTGTGTTICLDAGDRPLHCPTIKCENSCAAHTDEKSCFDDPKCYAVLADAGTCDCNTPGCCMQFKRCDLGPPQCSPGAAAAPCKDLPWDCGPDYDPVFNGACQTGCVRTPICSGDCRTRGCPTGTTCQLCWTTYECMAGPSTC
jgi:hypothetical protein